MPEQPRFYRPAWFLRLYVRLEDYGIADDGTGQDGSKPYKSGPSAQKQETRATVEAELAEQQAAAATAGVRSRATLLGLRSDSRKLSRSQSTKRSAAGDDGDGDEFSLPPFVTVPQSMKIQDKGFRTAAELTATFPAQDLPLDPRIIRECRVEAWVGTVDAQSFASPEQWHLQPGISETCVLRFNGYVDLPEMFHDDAVGLMSLKARSYESVLIDGKINPRAAAYRITSASGKERLTSYLNRILAQYPPTSGQHGDPLRAFWYAADPDKEPYLDRKTLLRTLKTAASQNASLGQSSPSADPTAVEQPLVEPSDPAGQGDSVDGGVPGMPPKSVKEDGMSTWDLFTQVCELCGCVPIYQPALPIGPASRDGVVETIDPANCIVVSPPQAFLDDISRARRISGGARDGFHREFSDGPSDVRFMVWGHNIGRMKLSRKLGKVRPTAVEVRAYNPDASAHLRVMSARFPSHGKKGGKGTSTNRATERGAAKMDVVRTFVMHGVRSQAALDQAAVAVFYELTRAELTINIDTDDLSSYMDPVQSMESGQLVQSHNGNPDLLRLCPGSPVHVTVAQKSSDASANIIVSSLSDFYSGQAHDVLDVLTKQRDRWRAWSSGRDTNDAQLAEMARKIQAAYAAAKLPDVFYCRAVTLTFTEQGFKAEMELASYMNADAGLTDDDLKKVNERKLKKHGEPRGQQSSASRTSALVEKVKRGWR